MTPQTPPPANKPYCVSYTTVSFTYFERLEDAFMHHLATLDRLNPKDPQGYDNGVIVQMWEHIHGNWVSDPVNDITELKPKPQT